MELVEEYRLSEYQDLGKLADKDQVHIVRNKITGQICVRKSVPLELSGIYAFLKENSSPYLPIIYECVRRETRLVVIEEYLTGQNLAEMLKSRDFSEEETIRIGIDLCRAMAPLHHASPPIICRDLKPENVIVTLEGALKVVDFDIARTYRPGQNQDTRMMGTQGFAAPEQFGFGQTDARTDIYGIGVLLNYLLTQRFPVDGIISGKLGQIIRCCTQLNPKERFQSVGALENALCGLVRAGQQNTLAAMPPCREHIPMDRQPKETPQQVVPQTHLHEDSGYHIPGFRSKKLWKMVVAVAGYFLITWFCFTLEFQTVDGVAMEGSMLWIDRSSIWISQILFIFLVCDYRGMRQYIPILNSKYRVVRVIGNIVAEFFALFMAALVCAILEMILG